MDRQGIPWGAVATSLLLVLGAGTLVVSQALDDGFSVGSLIGLVVGVTILFGILLAIFLAGCLSERRRRSVLSRPGVTSAISAVMLDPRDALHRLAQVQVVLEPKPRWIAVSTTDTGLDVWDGLHTFRLLCTLPWGRIVLVERSELISGGLRRPALRVHVEHAGFEGAVDFAPTGGPGWIGIAREQEFEDLLGNWTAAAQRARR